MPRTQRGMVVRKRTKFLLLRSSIILVFAILAGRIWYVQVVMGSYYRGQADTSKIRILPDQALRGIVYDRNGRQLVSNDPSWNVMIVPHGAPQNAAAPVYAQLSRLLGGHPSSAALYNLVMSNQWRAYEPVLVKKRIPSTVALVIKQLHTQLPGVRAELASYRRYVNDPGMSLAHILGYTGEITSDTYPRYRHGYPLEHYGLTDTIGRAGLELGLESYLHGVNGNQQVEVDARELPIRTLGARPSIPGDSVYLTINDRLQRHVAQDLQAGAQQLGVRRGVAVVEDVHTGQILAMVSLPSFNNTEFSRGISQARFNKLNNDPATPLNDQATAGTFPPGSTYKVVTATAALESGAVDAGTTVDDTGAIKIGSRVFQGWKPGGLGNMNVISALALSSDIYFYTVAGGNPNLTPDPPHVGATKIAKYANMFGLGSPLGIDLPNESSGFVPTPQWFNNLKPAPLVKNPGDIWTIGKTYNVAIGQGEDLVTPLQMASITATIANGGTVYRPRIVKNIVGRVVPHGGVSAHNRVVQAFAPQILRHDFINSYDLGLIQQGMHQSVSNDWNTGTSREVYDPRIDAAGKTGTAEAPGGADAWWIGYAPYNNPEIAVSVLMPGSSTEGAYGAAPIAHKIFEDYFGLPARSVEHPGSSDWLLDISKQLPSGSGSQ